MCAEGWTGSLCTEDIDECSNDPCDEPSNCVNTPGSFECICYGQLMEPFCGAVKKTVIVCEGGKLELRCPDGKISIDEAVFGRTEGGNVCPHRQIKSTNCQSASSLTEVRSKCDGQKSCSITVSNGVLGGDPCPGTYKYLEVTFTCVVQ
eukprot:XP_011438739.1 PREDICTED: D-galactoside-specific lectin [Crassostrea gigas]